VLSICPPVRAKLPEAELSFDGTAKLNIAVLPFSDSCKVKVRLPPATPTRLAAAMAIVSVAGAAVVDFSTVPVTVLPC
jgi:hypothetical protein